jgi:transposase-like protein
MNKTSKFSPEVRERAVRMVLEYQGEHESQWAANGRASLARSASGSRLWSGKIVS